MAAESGSCQRTVPVELAPPQRRPRSDRSASSFRIAACSAADRADNYRSAEPLDFTGPLSSPCRRAAWIERPRTFGIGAGGGGIIFARAGSSSASCSDFCRSETEPAEKNGETKNGRLTKLSIEQCNKTRTEQNDRKRFAITERAQTEPADANG